MDSMPLTICTVVTFFVHIDKDPLENGDMEESWEFKTQILEK